MFARSCKRLFSDHLLLNPPWLLFEVQLPNPLQHMCIVSFIPLNLVLRSTRYFYTHSQHLFPNPGPDPGHLQMHSLAWFFLLQVRPPTSSSKLKFHGSIHTTEEITRLLMNSYGHAVTAANLSAQDHSMIILNIPSLRLNLQNT